MTPSSRARTLNQLEKRLEEFLEENKHDIDVDEIATIEDAICVVQNVRDREEDPPLQIEDEDQDFDYDDI